MEKIKVFLIGKFKFFLFFFIILWNEDLRRKLKKIKKLYFICSANGLNWNIVVIRLGLYFRKII